MTAVATAGRYVERTRLAWDPWLFGAVRDSEVHLREPKRAAGFLQLRRARVRWFLSSDIADLPAGPPAGAPTSHRSMTLDGDEVQFSDGFTGLHTRVYEGALAGRGPGIDEARASIELAHRIRHAAVTPNQSLHHAKIAQAGR